MKRIIYFCPKLNEPIGGIKVIHRHSQIINEHLGSSQVFYMYGSAMQVDWFAHAAAIKTEAAFDPASDFVVLPENQIFGQWKTLRDLRISYGIFVQNGYLLRRNIDEKDFEQAYDNAQVILCISQDAIRCVLLFFPHLAHKIVRVSTSVDEDVFRPGDKEKLITYMPRKLAQHAELVVAALGSKLGPSWRIVALDNLSERQVADALARSAVFMSFSELEGLGLPPAEAAFAGNYVVGYTGQGGAEYWHPPAFYRVPSGDIVRFVDEVLSVTARVDRYGFLNTGTNLALLRQSFSKATELSLLGDFVEAVTSRSD